MEGSDDGFIDPEQWIVDSDESGLRLDHYLRNRDIEPTRSRLKQLIEDGYVTVDGVSTGRPSQKVKVGQLVRLCIPPPRPLNAEPQDIPLDIRHEDEHVIVLNKPVGMVVHPAPGHPGGTLVNALVHRFSIQAGESLRPGLVHRLDKNTSGLMVIARTEPALRHLVQQFQEHTVNRQYTALVVGNPPPRLEIDTLHGRHPKDRKRFSSRVTSGKRAWSTLETLEYFAGAAWIRMTLHTGRTHQVRVHCHDHGFPVLGDPLYPPRRLTNVLRELQAQLCGQALHAELLGFEHPATGQRIRFTEPPPQVFLEALLRIRKAL